MNVPAQVKQRVESKLRQNIAKIKSHYKIDLNMPTVSYSLRGGTAGRANYIRWHVELNPVLLMENLEDFLARTVPHELAHLACHRIYPEAYDPFHNNDEAAGILRMMRNAGRRVRRPKREVHGPRWKEIMRVLGAPATRCHTYDVTNVKRRKSRHEYRCTGCGAVITAGPKIHKQIQRDPTSRWHSGCRGARLELVSSAAPVRPKAAPKPARKTSAPRVRIPVRGTKIYQAYQLYKQWHNRYDRKGMIAVFRNEIGMTEAGASTYVYQCQKLYQQGVV